MAKKDETQLSEEDVYQEHLKDVNVGLHWTYMFGVMVGAVALMLLFIAILGSG